MPEDPSKVEVGIDAVLASLQRRISQLVMEAAIAEAQSQQLTENVASLQAENAQLTELLHAAQGLVEPAPEKLRAVAPE